MTSYPEAEQIQDILNNSKTVVVVQADNPDTDSLASALALEQILGDLGKEPILYCGVDLPTYLSYIPGSDRVLKDFPKQFDASIIVDTSSDSLLEKVESNHSKSWMAAKPVIIIDHHSTEPTIDFANVVCSHSVVATGEVLYELTQQLKWPLNDQAKDLITMAILSDSLGLMSEGTGSRSIRIIAELVDGGVSLAKLDNLRRITMRREPELIAYKGRLLQRVEFYGDNRIAMLTIPWEEIEQYSPLYNPPMLVMDDMRLAKGTDVAICFKVYRDGKVTAKIRCNYGVGIADKLAEHFGGGGHSYASGFKITDGRSYDNIKLETISKTTEILDNLAKEKS
jgi:phosphoesterase RecJ-like protein